MQSLTVGSGVVGVIYSFDGYPLALEICVVLGVGEVGSFVLTPRIQLRLRGKGVHLSSPQLEQKSGFGRCGCLRAFTFQL